jgi:hypothetical protein
MQVTGGLKSSGEGKKNLLILGRTIDPKHMAKFNAFLKLKCHLEKFQDPHTSEYEYSRGVYVYQIPICK